MNRTDRMFAIVLDLQARGRQRAEDLAARYETSVRTIYRDVMALCEAGVPVVSLPGSGYALPDTYFLPPLSLTLEEVTALSLGADHVADTLDASYSDAAKRAQTKILAILPQPIRQSVDRARGAMKLVGEPPAADGELDALRALRTAILEERVVTFLYHGRARAGSYRRVAPYGLARLGARWYCMGHAYERNAVRLFRLSRMEQLALTADRFERPADFEMKPMEEEEAPTIVVRFTFESGLLRWMRERLTRFEASIEEDGDRYIVTLHVHSEEGMLDWILSWGARITLLEPASLCERLRAEARA
ncbi:MAG TPA: YafY family protein, partial [Candidatus Baltobacteraceae bacterium]